MTHRILIATGAAALAGLGLAGSAAAAPVINDVQVNKTAGQALEVEVGTERGTDSARPRIAVTSSVVRVNREGEARRANLRVPAVIGLDDWQGVTKPGAPVTATATLTGVKQAVGTPLLVRVRACDSDGCITVNRRTTVQNESSRSSSSSTSAGARSADDAVKAALRAVGAGSTLVSVEREDDDGAAWEVTVRRADGATVEVYVGAGGSVMRTEVDDDDDDDRAAPLPSGSVGSARAVAVALAHVGQGSSLVGVEREDDAGVAWEVEVRASNGATWEVEVSPTGKVVNAEIDD